MWSLEYQNHPIIEEKKGGLLHVHGVKAKVMPKSLLVKQKRSEHDDQTSEWYQAWWLIIDAGV